MSDEPAQPDLVTKSAFADLCGVSPGRVSQWIAAGQITGGALVGEGRSARIHVETARAQLRHRLDVGRRLGNGMGTRLASAPAGDPPPPTATPPPGIAVPAAAPVPTLPRSDYLDPVEERIKAEKLDEIARRNRIAAQREAADSGRYIEAAAARREMGLIADGILQLVEQSLATFATALAERFSGAPARRAPPPAGRGPWDARARRRGAHPPGRRAAPPRRGYHGRPR